MKVSAEYWFVVGVAVFTLIGELVLKWRINDLSFALTGTPTDKVISIIKLLFDPFIMAGLFSAVISACFWLAALSRFDLSYAYPLVIAILSVLTIIFSVILLGEKVSTVKAAGVFLVVLGLVILWRGEVQITGGPV